MPVKGIGTDLVEIKRIEESAGKKEKFLERIFTKEEIEYCFSYKNPWPHLAARFAAKEAFLKLVGVGIFGCSLKDIAIQKDETGKPAYSISGQALSLATEKGIRKYSLSISHDGQYAIAFAVGED